MSEQDPTVHKAVEQGIDEIMSNVSVSSDPRFNTSTQTADIEGRRITVHAENTDGYVDEHREVSVSDNAIDRLGTIPEPHVPNNDRDLGLRHVKAALSRSVPHSRDGREGAVYSRATVDTDSGLYIAKEGTSIDSQVVVEREGYGRVEIKDPRAKDLVARLAAKTIKQAQVEVQEVKGKELVEDHKWLKTARRTARSAAGKKTEKAA